MTLLERWDKSPGPWVFDSNNDEIRRAIAIAQAVEERHRDQEYFGSDIVDEIMRRADELLEGK